MKAYIEQLLRDVADPITGRNLLREYLQARILESLQRTGARSITGKAQHPHHTTLLANRATSPNGSPCQATQGNINDDK